MYKLLCQLFLAVVGRNLPEEVFEGTLYWLLQGKRKKRQIIDLNVKQFSLTTPHQLEIIGWPREYIDAETSKGINKIYSIVKCKMFRNIFHTEWIGEVPKAYHMPCHRYIKLWSHDGISKARVILYFNTREALNKTKALISFHRQRNDKFEGKILSYKLETKDRSHMSCCYFCAKFMPCLSERLHTNDRNADIFDNIRRRSSSVSWNQDWNNNLSNTPICVECHDSKERQGHYRMNMFNSRAFIFGEYSDPLSSSERREYNIRDSIDTEKPDMTLIPHCDNYGNHKTPLDYTGSYARLIDTYSEFYWHPELTADEYMRLQEHKMLKYLGNVDPLDEDDYPEDDPGEDLYDDYDDPDDYLNY